MYIFWLNVNQYIKTVLTVSILAFSDQNHDL